MPTATRASAPKTAKSKPYDRKVKDKAPRINEGAPAQLGQSSRKGKKAWRKHVDVREEEEALERKREEERTTGGAVASKGDNDLFMVDTTGDEVVAKRMRKEKKPLRSLAILNERSALPAFTARNVAAPQRKTKISGKEKARLRRIAGRTEDGSADVRKTDVQGLHDAWVAAAPQVGLQGGFGDEGVLKQTVKTPETLQKLRDNRRALIESQLAEELPVAGVSYNPAAEAHSALMKQALEEELELLKREQREAERIATLGEVVVSRRENDNEFSETMVGGMRIGRGDGFESEEEESETEGYKPKPSKRKNQAQRNKAARAKAKLLEAREAANRKRTAQAILAAKSTNKDIVARQKASEEAARLRKLAAEKRERVGFEGGEKIGKHRVAKGSVAVQLGEDLAESLRQVKPEGNLFKDRFLALQKRGQLEPRVRQLPKKRALKVKEYEKHAWKNFK